MKGGSVSIFDPMLTILCCNQPSGCVYRSEQVHPLRSARTMTLDQILWVIYLEAAEIIS